MGGYVYVGGNLLGIWQAFDCETMYLLAEGGRIFPPLPRPAIIVRLFSSDSTPQSWVSYEKIRLKLSGNCVCEWRGGWLRDRSCHACWQRRTQESDNKALPLESVSNKNKEEIIQGKTS